MTKLRERGPTVLMWAAVVVALAVAMETHGVSRALAAYVLVWWMLALAVLGFTEEDPMMVDPGEAAIQHVGLKVLATAIAAAVIVGPPAWLLLAG